MDYHLEQWINGPAGSHPLWDALMVGAAAGAQAAFIALVGAWFLIGWRRDGSAGLRWSAREPSRRLWQLVVL